METLLGILAILAAELLFGVLLLYLALFHYKIQLFLKCCCGPPLDFVMPCTSTPQRIFLLCF